MVSRTARATHRLQIDRCAPISLEEAKILVCIGNFSKDPVDIARQLPIHRSTINDKCLLLQAKGMLKYTEFGFVNCFLGSELRQIADWIAKIEALSGDEGVEFIKSESKAEEKKWMNKKV